MTNTDGATTVLAVVGSLRSASINKQIAQVAVDNAEDGIAVRLYEGLGELPFYNEEIDTAALTGPAQTLRAAVARADAVLVVTPEYNGTIPAAVKNAIDWLSRPYGNGALNGKPVAVIGASQGQYGGVWAHDEARKSLGIAGARVIDGLTMSLPTQVLEGKDPRQIADVVNAVGEVVRKLAVESS
ncbi:NAD(P)H-dependent oxidoreductase [Mycolicibacterium wolinskyi]|uniref:NAD(P)H-dependent oxidoreductase n=1 Tax=Mycolicibacterium wolinskyi TaxID=59750 RepID=UPI00391793F0